MTKGTESSFVIGGPGADRETRRTRNEESRGSQDHHNHPNRWKPMQTNAKPMQTNAKPMQNQCKPMQNQCKPMQTNANQCRPMQNQCETNATQMQNRCKPMQTNAKQCQPMENQCKPMQNRDTELAAIPTEPTKCNPVLGWNVTSRPGMVRGATAGATGRGAMCHRTVTSEL